MDILHTILIHSTHLNQKTTAVHSKTIPNKAYGQDGHQKLLPVSRLHFTLLFYAGKNNCQVFLIVAGL
jgi:hypothetical protein